MKTEIMYQSEGKAENGEPFITIKKARGYYEYAERAGVDSIAFILWDSDKQLIGVIKESKPPLDEFSGKVVTLTTAFGGSIDCDYTPKHICQIEVLEEAGYKVPLSNVKEVGTTMVSTQMSQKCYGFIVDVSGISKTHKAEYESSSYDESVEWLSYKDLLSNDDWKSIWIVTKAQYKGIL